MRIYYLIPDVFSVPFRPRAALRALVKRRASRYLRQVIGGNHRPVGGIKMHYLHCQLLREAGYDAVPLVLGRHDGNFFDYRGPILRPKDLLPLGPDDVVVATEFFPYQGLEHSPARKVVFVQNWVNLRRRLRPEDQGRSYLDLGYDHVMTCGKIMRDAVAEAMGIDSSIVTNGIDPRVFFPDPGQRQAGRVMCLPRKNPKDLERIKEMVQVSGRKVRFVDVHGVPEAEIAQQFRRSDIFLATGYPEGFGLPVLEAMASGATVVGFSGKGALEFMDHERSALVAPDGDCETAARELSRVLDDPNLKEHLRAGGHETAARYTLEETGRQLVRFFSSLAS